MCARDFLNRFRCLVVLFIGPRFPHFHQTGWQGHCNVTTLPTSRHRCAIAKQTVSSVHILETHSDHGLCISQHSWGQFGFNPVNSWSKLKVLIFLKLEFQFTFWFDWMEIGLTPTLIHSLLESMKWKCNEKTVDLKPKPYSAALIS